MIVYYSPGRGLGKATRAAAICRHLDDVLVVRVGQRHDPLEWRGVPYITFETKKEAQDFINGLNNVFVIIDEDPNRTITVEQPHDYIYRLGRPRSNYLLSIEPPGSGILCWPIVSLDDNEILSREEAREDLGFNQTERVEIAIDSASQPLSILRLNPNAYHLQKYPAMRWMNAADKIYAAAGYNTWAEVAYLELEAEWISVRYDQKLRMRSPVCHTDGNMSRRAAEVISTAARAFLLSTNVRPIVSVMKPSSEA